MNFGSVSARIAPTVAVFALFSSTALSGEVVMDWVAVGNSGNAADTTGHGAVAYDYEIGRYEVTNAQYAAFLNAADPTGANARGLYSSSMATGAGGIAYTSANAEGLRFSARAGRENNPVNFVSWLDAARFVNWLHNGQGSGSTETGVYEINNGLTETRSVDATYFLPSADEWYKAAYHDAQAGTDAVYYLFANGSNDNPHSDTPGDDPNAVNYFRDDGSSNGFDDGYVMTGSRTVPTAPLTDVGAYTEADSPYGTFDQNGNVAEWNEALLAADSRGTRGGSWEGSIGLLKSTVTLPYAPTTESVNTGFRVARFAPVVPEPTSFALTLLCAIPLLRRPRH